jgi:hypothetical protein
LYTRPKKSGITKIGYAGIFCCCASSSRGFFKGLALTAVPPSAGSSRFHAQGFHTGGNTLLTEWGAASYRQGFPALRR